MRPEYKQSKKDWYSKLNDKVNRSLVVPRCMTSMNNMSVQYGLQNIK